MSIKNGKCVGTSTKKSYNEQMPYFALHQAAYRPIKELVESFFNMKGQLHYPYRRHLAHGLIVFGLLGKQGIDFQDLHT